MALKCIYVSQWWQGIRQDRYQMKRKRSAPRKKKLGVMNQLNSQKESDEMLW